MRKRSRRPPRKGRLHLALRVNGETVETAFAPNKTLLEVLREDLGLTGTKHGCELGECGTCTVLVDGTPILSCLAMPQDLEGCEITTVEGLADTGRSPSEARTGGAGDGGKLHPLQETFADLGAAQCGYCTPGFLCVAKALLEANPKPSREEIKEALAGNLCRCTGYVKIYEAVELAAARMRGEKAEAKRESLHGR